MSEVQENVSVVNDVSNVVQSVDQTSGQEVQQMQQDNVLPPEDVFCRQVDVIIALRSAFSKFVEAGGTEIGDLVNNINTELGAMPLFKAQGGPPQENAVDQQNVTVQQ